jgi:hypothetical protein
MEPAWEEMEAKLAGKVNVYNIERTTEEAQIQDFETTHGVKLVQKGYPTIFKIVNKEQIDYNGPRDLKSLLEWAEKPI